MTTLHLPKKNPEILFTTDEKSTVIVCYKTQKRIAKLDFFSPLFYFMLLSLHDKKRLEIVTNF